MANQANKRAWTRFISKYTGCRIGKDGGKKRTKPDAFEHYHIRLREWIVKNQMSGKALGDHDLLAEFEFNVHEEKWELEVRRDEQGGLTNEEGKRLEVLTDKLTVLKGKYGRT